MAQKVQTLLVDDFDGSDAEGTVRFSQRVSADHLVLELHEDERGFYDVADRGRADRDSLQGAPPLGHQREAAFSLVAQGPQERVAGFRIDIEFAAARFPHRDVHARAGPFKTGISQERQVLEVGPGLRQDEVAGGGQVAVAAGQHTGDPQRHAARGGQRLHVPGGLVRLAGVPLIDLPALPAGLLVRAAVGGDERAVQDEVGKPLLTAFSRASRSVGAFAASTSTASSLYRYAVAWEIPKPRPSRGMSGRSRNHASVKTACFQQVRARVPSRVPISRR